MADNQPAKVEHEIAPIVDRDALLADLVDFVNRLDLELQGADVGIPVILTVGGALISGYAIGGATWLKRFGQQWKNGFDNLAEEGPEEAAQAGAFFENKYAQIADRVYGNPDDPSKPLPSFIHLRDARLYHPSGAVPVDGEGMLWRGRLTAVDGFAFGLLGPKS
ncbi:MAG TPA: hypothetical protein VGM82_04770 [Gemmatimonadaceae bacterium]